MVIVYNPSDGAPIKGFICKGILLDPFYPDGYELSDGKRANGLMQYENEQAHELVNTYQFLKVQTPEQVEAILNRPPELEYQCDFPGCEFATGTKVALIGHQKKHAKERAENQKPVIDPKLVPVAGGKRIPSVAQAQQMRDNRDTEGIPQGNGVDADGVSWYGEGAQIEKPNSKNSFGGEKVAGQGHFKG